MAAHYSLCRQLPTLRIFRIRLDVDQFPPHESSNYCVVLPVVLFRGSCVIDFPGAWIRRTYAEASTSAGWCMSNPGFRR